MPKPPIKLSDLAHARKKWRRYGMQVLRLAGKGKMTEAQAAYRQAERWEKEIARLEKAQNPPSSPKPRKPRPARGGKRASARSSKPKKSSPSAPKTSRR